jgi:hypothetical protein
MADSPTTRLDLAELLMAVENAPPVAAADVLGERLAATFGAAEVSLLVADLSGRALIRLGHAGSDEDARTKGRETAERVSLVGSPQGRALAEQTLVVQDTIEGPRVFAPVTNRGEAIGVLELTLGGAPDEQTLADVALAAHALAVRRHRQSPFHRPLRVGSAVGPALARRGGPASPPSGRVHM